MSVFLLVFWIPVFSFETPFGLPRPSPRARRAFFARAAGVVFGLDLYVSRRMTLFARFAFASVFRRRRASLKTESSPTRRVSRIRERMYAILCRSNASAADTPRYGFQGCGRVSRRAGSPLPQGVGAVFVRPFRPFHKAQPQHEQEIDKGNQDHQTVQACHVHVVQTAYMLGKSEHNKYRPDQTSSQRYLEVPAFGTPVDDEKAEAQRDSAEKLPSEIPRPVQPARNSERKSAGVPPNIFCPGKGKSETRRSAVPSFYFSALLTGRGRSFARNESRGLGNGSPLRRARKKNGEAASRSPAPSFSRALFLHQLEKLIGIEIFLLG